MSVTILAIESSCDDTSAAILKDGNILANLTATQEVHKKYGGVVPELASRAHQKHIIPVVDGALRKAGISKDQLSAVAFTLGPGLLGSLIVGSSFAKAFSMALGIPLISVHHMQAHILAHFIDQPRPSFPFICLTVSGGHTQIVKVNDYLDMEILGETIDDAAGEAFDKSAKLLGLEYPGGPLIDKLAKQGNAIFPFAKPKVSGLNYSFSGLKTSILYFLRDQQNMDPNFIDQNLHDLCASIQLTVVDILLKKLVKAAEQHDISEVAIAGGVSANSLLRSTFYQTGKEKGWNTYIPAFEYCTDNAAMIAMAAYFKYKENSFAPLDTSPEARLKFR